MLLVFILLCFISPVTHFLSSGFDFFSKLFVIWGLNGVEIYNLLILTYVNFLVRLLANEEHNVISTLELIL